MSESFDLEAWIDRDLSQAVARGELPMAFEVEEVIRQVEDLLAGHRKRSPVFVGGRGVGKTTVVHQLLRRSAEGEGWPSLESTRVVQLSLRAIAARFRTKDKGAQQFAEICNYIVSQEGAVVPFIRDVHLAYAFDWEPILHRFLDRMPVPVLCEAEPKALDEMLEYWTDFDALLAPIRIDEPGVARVRRIVDAWCEEQVAAGGPDVDPGARRAAIELTARFMGDRPFPRKVIDLLAQTVDLHMSEPSVSVQHVVHRFSQLTQVPEGLVDPQVPLDLGEVREFVGGRLLGQDEAVDSVVRMIALIKAGLADLRRPLGAFLFVGPTGVGKTHCAQLLAEYLFGDRHRLVRLNMADYGNPGGAEIVFGNPLASRPKDQRGELTNRLRGQPFGVLLLDEFEKAEPGVHDRFLQLLDEGRFINARGETVSLTSIIVIATSNAGAEVYRSGGLGFEGKRDPKEQRRSVERRLQEQFRFELLNRFDRVVHFRPLGRSEIRQIARRELRELSMREGLSARGVKLEIDQDVLDWLVSHGYHPHFGARFLRREIERNVVGTLAEYVVREMPTSGDRVALGVRRGRIHARLVRAATGEQTEESPPAIPRRQLLEEAEAWLQRFERLEGESAVRKAEASRLIEASSSRGFWDDRARAEDVLRRYKVLDARLQVERRLLKPVEQLRAAVKRDEDSVVEDLGALVSGVAHAYRRWVDLGAPDAPNGVWLILGPADSLAVSAEWLVDLVGMYRGWLRRKGYTYEVVAEEVVGGEVTRLVMEVDGPGALSVLEMEEGEHRRKSPQQGVDRARVWVIPRSEGRQYGAIPGGEVSDAKRGRGIAVARRAARLTLQAPRLGLELVLHGASTETLALLGRDIGGVLSMTSAPTEIAREYAMRGGAVRDPRTSASVASVKDVARGHLETFLRAWEAR